MQGVGSSAGHPKLVLRAGRTTAGKKCSQAGDRDGFGSMSVPSNNGGGSRQRIEDGFFRGLDSGGDHGIEVGVGQLGE